MVRTPVTREPVGEVLPSADGPKSRPTIRGSGYRHQAGQEHFAGRLVEMDTQEA